MSVITLFLTSVHI